MDNQQEKSTLGNVHDNSHTNLIQEEHMFIDDLRARYESLTKELENDEETNLLITKIQKKVVKEEILSD
jgi:hypothetical protein